MRPSCRVLRTRPKDAPWSCSQSTTCPAVSRVVVRGRVHPFFGVHPDERCEHRIRKGATDSIVEFVRHKQGGDVPSELTELAARIVKGEELRLR